MDFVLFLKTYLINHVNNQRICVPCEITQKIEVMGKKEESITNGLHLGKSEVLRNSRHYLWVHSQGHHTLNRLEERGMGRGSDGRSSLI